MMRPPTRNHQRHSPLSIDGMISMLAIGTTRFNDCRHDAEPTSISLRHFASPRTINAVLFRQELAHLFLTEGIYAPALQSRRRRGLCEA